MLTRPSNITKYILSGLLIFWISGTLPAFSQENISGVINQYSKVTSVGSNNVIVANPELFGENDTVLLMQMCGGIIYESGTPGQLLDTIGAPGSYEFLVVSTVVSNTVTFTQTLTSSYSIKGRVQLIKVPLYKSAIVTSTLTCSPWDSTYGIGGVLAFVVERHLTLNANIDVSGKGFRGGAVSQGLGTCMENGGTYDLFFYNSSSNYSGFKGEGIGNKINDRSIDISPGYLKGKAPSFTGGGGANGHFSGGGGGSNYGAGATGDVEISGCSVMALRGGLYGFKVASSQVDGGVFMGGGGGSSTYQATANTSPGGNGGGIVIICTETLSGNGHTISADGAPAPANNITLAGAGGGGAGGSVILQAQTFLSDATLTANGGAGGNTSNTTGGAGGGGGGGLIWTRGSFSGTATVNGGTSGLPSHSSNMTGAAGQMDTDLTLPMNGFLYNFVFSTNQTLQDTTCYGLTPPTLYGTHPTGGDGTYTYQWQKSYNNSNWFNIAGTANDYTPAAADTMHKSAWFHRIVYSGTFPSDISDPVLIIVLPALSGIGVGTDNTICSGQDPVSLSPSSSPTGGDGIYNYTWQQSLNSSTWSVADGLPYSDSYNPDPLTNTHYYWRIVNSGACTDTSNIVTVTVLPIISGNTIANIPLDQVICDGTAFTDLSGSAPAGGDGVYRYVWEQSTTSATVGFTAAPGVNNLINYNPADTPPDTYYFRRVIMSGLNDCCVNTSVTVARLVSHPVITNNSISGTQTICAGSTRTELTGTLPGGGGGIGSYSFIWEKSPNGINSWTTVGGDTQNLAGEQLFSDTYYRRTVTSAACTNTSANVLVTVVPAITNYSIDLDPLAHDTIRTGDPAGNIIVSIPSGGLGAGTYNYSWSESANGVNFTDLSVTTPDYQPGILTNTTWFRRTVTSGPCVFSSTIKITVLPLIANNTVTGNQQKCNTDIPNVINGQIPSGGDGIYRYLWQQRDTVTNTWNDADGINSNSGYSPSYLSRDTEFRRIVYSGENDCCKDTSNFILVQIDILPLLVYAGRDTTLHPYQFAMFLDGGFSGGGTGLWSVGSSDGDPEFDDPADSLTAVTKLGFGENILRWTVSSVNKICSDQSDEVTVTVPKVIIPEAFSPNNDGLNDYFIVDGLEFTAKNELVIINTGGAIVYKTENYRSDDPALAWNGVDNNGSPLPEGTYYFLLTIKGALDGADPDYVAHISGFIIIRR